MVFAQYITIDFGVYININNICETLIYNIANALFTGADGSRPLREWKII